MDKDRIESLRLPSAGAVAAIRKELLLWYAENGRELPWRANYSPYEVWISEMMLQQTRIKTMLPFYARWMERFPDPASIARSGEDEVLRFWEGLGYYARAKNIHKAALRIVSEFGGRLPRDFESLRGLPGIGRYTAGAIMSFAYNADYPAADANAARILARLFDIAAPSGTKEFQDSVWRFASEILPPGRARDFNQALMDFGSLVCLPREPLCPTCPATGCCLGLERGVAALRPANGRKKAPVAVVRAIGVCLAGGKVLVRKRPASGLMPNLWEFPGGDALGGESPEQALRRAWRSELGVTVDRAESLSVIRHSHTSFRVTLHVYLFRIPALPLPEFRTVDAPLRWVPLEELDGIPFPAAHRRAARLLGHRLSEAAK